VVINKQAKPEDTVTISRSKIPYYETFNSVMHLKHVHTGEVSIEQFKLLREYPIHFSEIIFSKVSELRHVSPVSIRREEIIENDEVNIAIDIPHVVLASTESSMVPKCFQLPGYKYIISRQSILQAHKSLNEEYETLCRGSHLYQECDMKHVTSRYNQIDRIRSLITSHPHAAEINV